MSRRRYYTEKAVANVLADDDDICGSENESSGKLLADDDGTGKSNIYVNKIDIKLHKAVDKVFEHNKSF